MILYVGVPLEEIQQQSIVSHTKDLPGKYMKDHTVEWKHPDIPYIGSSPDSIVNCSRCGYGILEIKYPYKIRYCRPLEAIHMMPCTRLGERVYYVNENSSWYSQAQVQLLCTNANYCNFVIYTSKGIAVTRIFPDPEWWIDNVQTLEKFFIKITVPRLCK